MKEFADNAENSGTGTTGCWHDDRKPQVLTQASKAHLLPRWLSAAVVVGIKRRVFSNSKLQKPKKLVETEQDIDTG